MEKKKPRKIRENSSVVRNFQNLLKKAKNLKITKKKRAKNLQQKSSSKKSLKNLPTSTPPKKSKKEKTESVLKR